MIRVAYFDTTTFIVSTILTGPDLTGFPDAAPGEQLAVLMSPDLEMPLYWDGAELQPLPPAPDPEYIWDHVTSSWVADVFESIRVFREQVNEIADVYYRQGFAYKPPGETDYLFVKITDWSMRRIRAITARLALAPAGLLDIVVFGENDTLDQMVEVTVTREQATEFALLAAAHDEGVAAFREGILIQVRTIEILADTDPAQAMLDLTALRSSGGYYTPVSN